MWTQDAVSLEVSPHQPTCFHTLSKLPRDSERVRGGTGGFWNTGARPSWAQGGSSGNAAVMLLQGTRDEDHRSVPKDAKKQWEIQEQRNGCGSIILPHWCGQQETQAADLIGYSKNNIYTYITCVFNAAHTVFNGCKLGQCCHVLKIRIWGQIWEWLQGITG